MNTHALSPYAWTNDDISLRNGSDGDDQVRQAYLVDPYGNRIFCTGLLGKSSTGVRDQKEDRQNMAGHGQSACQSERAGMEAYSLA